jgi:hypothetical protein
VQRFAGTPEFWLNLESVYDPRLSAVELGSRRISPKAGPPHPVAAATTLWAPAEVRMPDRDHWSASMLLRWVLTRDIGAVLSMVNDYGGCLVEGDKVRRVQPQTWDDVMRAYSIDDSLRKEEQVANAVLKAELFRIPAQEEIYSSLRRGEIDAWARPNGSGDIVKIAPIQWAGLRWRALEGHDIAVPVDSEETPLPLPRPLADYLSGSVLATSLPTVWPDPLFPAEQAAKLWLVRVAETLAVAPEQASLSPSDFVKPKLAGTAERRPQRRLEYKSALETFMARKNPELLKRLSNAAIAGELVADCEDRAREGKPVPKLPNDRRNIENQISKVRGARNTT